MRNLSVAAALLQAATKVVSIESINKARNNFFNSARVVHEAELKAAKKGSKKNYKAVKTAEARVEKAEKSVESIKQSGNAMIKFIELKAGHAVLVEQNTPVYQAALKELSAARGGLYFAKKQVVKAKENARSMQIVRNVAKALLALVVKVA